MRVWASDREWRQVVVLATAASLSAFSFWQATRFAEKDAEVRERARLATIDAASDERDLQTRVDFDLDLYTGYCAASTERDSALATMFASGTGDETVAQHALVTQRLRADSLWGLLQADFPSSACGDYSIDRAREWETAADPTFGAAGQPPALADDGAAQAERQLMYSAVAFAAALFLLTVARLAESRSTGTGVGDDRRSAPGRWWRRLSWLALGIGAGLVVVHVRPLTIALWLGVTGVALALAYRRANRATRDSIPDAKKVRRRAELVGGLALVALALAALNLSAVAGRERSARARADRQSVAAERILEAGEQSALHDLTTSAELAELDARAAAVNQGAGSSEEYERIVHARKVTIDSADAQAERTAKALEEVDDLVPDGTCPRWKPPELPDYNELLQAAWADPMTLGNHLATSRESGEACGVMAGLSLAEADVWSARAALLTVALVALGLGGFLLALAADPDRSEAPARWLLSLGVAGVVAGAALALSVFGYGLFDQVGLRPSARVSFANDVAAAQTALAAGDCGDALENLNDLDSHARYGPVYTLRAEARLCSEDEMLLVAPQMPTTQAKAALDDLERAAKLREPGPSEQIDMAWLGLLVALDEPGSDDAALHDAAEDAADAAQAASDSASPGAHVARFNDALARLVVGENAEPQYRYALRCLDREASCPGGGIEDPNLVTQYRLMALDDLELLAGRITETELDRYRALIMSDDAVAVSPEPGAEWSLYVFPQELDVLTDEQPETDLSIVWYRRAEPDGRWDVVRTASLATATPGAPNWTPTYEALPAGEYRADIYTGGRLSHAFASWDGGPDDQRKVVPELGLSAVAPSDWKVTSHQEGVEASLGLEAQPDALVFRRIEGVSPDVDREVGDWLDDRLDEWVAAAVGPEAAESHVDLTPDAWYLGLDDDKIHVHQYAGGDVWAAIGILPYATDPYCGGTVFMTLARGAGSPEVTAVLDSLVLDLNTPGLEPLTGSLGTDSWSIDLPADWVGADLASFGSNDQFVAQQCRTGAELAIRTEEVAPEELTGDDPLADVAHARVEDLVAGAGLTRVRDEKRTRLDLGDPAVEVTLIATVDGAETEQRVIYLLDDTTLTTLTFTAPRDGDSAGAVQGVLDSFALVDG